MPAAPASARRERSGAPRRGRRSGEERRAASAPTAMPRSQAARPVPIAASSPAAETRSSRRRRTWAAVAAKPAAASAGRSRGGASGRATGSPVQLRPERPRGQVAPRASTTSPALPRRRWCSLVTGVAVSDQIRVRLRSRRRRKSSDLRTLRSSQFGQETEFAWRIGCGATPFPRELLAGSRSTRTPRSPRSGEPNSRRSRSLVA